MVENHENWPSRNILYRFSDADKLPIGVTFSGISIIYVCKFTTWMMTLSEADADEEISMGGYCLRMDPN